MRCHCQTIHAHGKWLTLFLHLWFGSLRKISRPKIFILLDLLYCILEAPIIKNGGWNLHISVRHIFVVPYFHQISIDLLVWIHSSLVLFCGFLILQLLLKSLIVPVVLSHYYFVGCYNRSKRVTHLLSSICISVSAFPNLSVTFPSNWSILEFILVFTIPHFPVDSDTTLLENSSNNSNLLNLT